MTEISSFHSPPLVPVSFKSTFSASATLSPSSLHFPHFPPRLAHNLSLVLAAWSPLLIFLPLSSFLPFPPSCEIAVVSYGFLFLRDGRWVHVGVEATKHAASAQHAWPAHTRRASCGYDSCHVHISACYQECAHSKNRTGWWEGERERE